MQNDLHNDDPKSIWQNQSTEASRMSLVLIRQKVRELQARTRRQMFTSLAGPLVIVVFYVFCIKEFAQWRQVLNALFAFELTWSVAGLYFLNRGMRPEAIPGDAGFSTGLDFCRHTIERQRDYFRRVLLWSFGPPVAAIGTSILTFAMVAGTDFLVKAMPFTVLAMVWVVAYLLVKVRQQREFQREINELSDVERENSGK